jgi:hypothetical protein
VIVLGGLTHEKLAQRASSSHRLGSLWNPTALDKLDMLWMELCAIKRQFLSFKGGDKGLGLACLSTLVARTLNIASSDGFNLSSSGLGPPIWSLYVIFSVASQLNNDVFA